MKLEEMVAHCKQQQVLQNRSDAMVTFVLPGIRGENRRLLGKAGPVGLVVGTRDKNSVVTFNADDAIAALEFALSLP